MSLKQEEPSMKRFPLLFLGLAVALASAAFPVFGADLPTLPAKGISEIDTLLQEAVRQGTVPGVVAIVTNKDRVLYHGAFGVMDTGKRKPMQKDSIFRIASMTKPVTSIAIMMLKEQGKLGLDDPVSKYLPAFQNREVISSFNPADATYKTKKAANEVLIRHLLTNTSGLAYAFSNDTVNRLQEKTQVEAEDLPLLYEPGTRWTYSGSTRVVHCKFLHFKLRTSEISNIQPPILCELPPPLRQPCQVSLLCQELFQRPDRRPPQHLTSANVFAVQNAALPANDGVVVETGMLANSNLSAD